MPPLCWQLQNTGMCNSGFYNAFFTATFLHLNKICCRNIAQSLRFSIKNILFCIMHYNQHPLGPQESCVLRCFPFFESNNLLRQSANFIQKPFVERFFTLKLFLVRPVGRRWVKMFLKIGKKLPKPDRCTELEKGGASNFESLASIYFSEGRFRLAPRALQRP